MNFMNTYLYRYAAMSGVIYKQKKSLAPCTIRVDEFRNYAGNFKRLKKSVFSYERFEVSKGEG